jgi:5,10-methylenetetrahydromethanopterin reductase
VSGLEVWKASVHVAGMAERTGAQAERDGFDGLSFGDTQDIAADPYCGLCLAARATKRLKLLVGVTNPVTRNAAVTAAAIATVQAESAGRAILGIGRGDSSLGHLRLPPATVRETERYVARVQAYLGDGEAKEAEAMPDTLRWVAQAGLPKVPVDVAATGPRVISLGARWAERVTVNVGAIPDRVSWALELARRAASDDRKISSPVSLGAYVVVAAHPDSRVAGELARGPLAAYAHLSGMSGAGGEQLEERDRSVVQAVAADYDPRFHGRKEGRHAAHLDDRFVRRFGIVGSPSHCASRLVELIELGVERLLVVEGLDPSQPEEQSRAHDFLVQEVLPEVRERVGAV